MEAIDQSRLTVAILAEVNAIRCRSGRAPLSRAPHSLTEVAAGHSTWMARANTMSHTGGRTAGRTLSDRVRNAGLRPYTYAENLAFLPRARSGTGGRLLDSRACRVQTAGGIRTGGHTYRSLARNVVSMWMNSSGHRRNLLSRKQRAMTVAAKVVPGGRCGRVWVTQIFTG